MGFVTIAILVVLLLPRSKAKFSHRAVAEIIAADIRRGNWSRIATQIDNGELKRSGITRIQAGQFFGEFVKHEVEVTLGKLTVKVEEVPSGSVVRARGSNGLSYDFLVQNYPNPLLVSTPFAITNSLAQIANYRFRRANPTLKKNIRPRDQQAAMKRLSPEIAKYGL